MKLEDQVSNLELSKRLCELKVKQNSLFHWVERDFNFTIRYELIYIELGRKMDDYRNPISAFSVAELGEKLPVDIKNEGWLNYCKSFNGWGGICERVSYDKWEGKKDSQVFIEHIHEIISLPYKPPEKPNDKTVDLFAKMLIYLIENKLL